MSSSSRSTRGALRRDRARCLRAAGSPPAVLLAAAACGAGGYAAAADTYWRPAVEARIEGHTNRDLATTDELEEEMAGYKLDLGFTWGRDTPRSATRIQPRVRFQDYPDRDDLKRVEQFLNIDTRYRSPRSDVSLVGRYSRRDAYTAELVEADFDEFDPEDPSVSQTSRLVTANTRTRVQIRPKYTYQIGERTGLSVSATAEAVDYETEGEDTQVDFDYWQLDGTWVRQLDPRSQLSVGPYVSRYEAEDASVESDAYGLIVEWEREWTERSSVGITLRAERNEWTRVIPVTQEESETAWEAMLHLESRAEASMWRVSLGRSITPTGSGTKANVDQFRVAYERALSPRLTSISAVRLLRTRSQTDFNRGDDRDYARLELGLQWAMTQTIFLGTGYEFTWREFNLENEDALNNSVFVSLRYQGLPPQR